ncbi:RloB family protein [Persicobacter diffluens]|uniref:RloB domain-containing protein n=1 Tax=Persicobacter diffluens TaxID=981 RepID=A0AAN4W5E8_9BACT|nr:hypothetical protein PEDI_55480 [Persicobacter diffluens]
MSRGRANRNRRAAKPKFSVIVDGETEIWYLQLMKQHEGLRHIDIKPELPKKKKMADQFELVLENDRIYDKVIWLVDLDVVLKEQAEWERKSGRSSPSPVEEFRGYFQRISSMDRVHLLVNTPCLEFWYLLHYKNTSRYFSDYNSLIREFRGTPLEDYEKSERYYKQGRQNLYQKLVTEQVAAIERASGLGEFNIEEMAQAKTEMFRLLELIRAV